MNTLRIFTALLALGASACSDEPSLRVPDASTEPDAEIDASVAPPITECTTIVTPADGGAPTWAELCEVDGGPRHVRVEGGFAPRYHASYQVFIGLDEPIGAQDELDPGVFKVQLYGGGDPAPAPAVTAYLGSVSEGVEGDASFVNEPSTFCFDLDGVESARLVLWVDGVNEASCDDWSSLTFERAFGVVDSLEGAVNREAGAYFYQASGVMAEPLVTLHSAAALTDAP